MEIQESVAVVTGSSSGIGFHTAERLLEKGAFVYGLSRSVTPIRHERFCRIKADLSRPEEIVSAFSEVRMTHPAVDILINNAGVGVFGDVEAITHDDWQRVISVNLTAAFLCTKEVVPAMKERQRGMIVNIASVAGKRGFKGGSAYSASKFGIAGFSESVMEELRPFGIRVSCIFPGSVDTPFFDTASLQPAKRMPPQEVARVIVSAIEIPDGILPDQIVIRPT
ncbi:MAG: SDR family NAD(P)-dependent oxidoreductase [Chlorobiaceae bacterium]|nr:SDR family NAD(P)-dependent oxidoreductase [Chlorobiaceae bacterium]NTW11664.1 SDR family NAD(P)-dependent oxidoreductase [Chlorobiaceae bacterium]